ncbi:MAG: transporter [Thermodesulfobacteriota bacterium]|nr:transporter [Thermodesulfobacteriota bacterium]
MATLKDKTAIVGIGETTYSKNSGMEDVELIFQAATRAICDAGITPKDIDGIIPGFSGTAAEEFISNFGIEDLRYTTTVRMGGASAVASLQSAAMAIVTGIASSVLCVSGWNGYSGRRVSALAERRESQLPMMTLMGDFEIPFGSFVPAQWYAPMARRHMYEYGTTSRQLGAVAVAMRKHAILNEKAIMKKPITIEDHQNSRMISDPFRLLDCCIESDGAAAVVVSSVERARDMKHPPVYISGVAEGHPDFPDQITNRPVMTELGIRKAAPRAFAMAGVTPGDIDVAEIYDCFTWVVICQLEDLGFCKKGEGGSFVQGGRIELGGNIPVNTHGGLLSQAHILGMNHIIEATKQLRHAAGPAQVNEANIALVSGYGDFGDGSVAILRR